MPKRIRKLKFVIDERGKAVKASDSIIFSVDKGDAYSDYKGS
ncbi:hypothetical protein [Mogibacterium timidum]|nr:hypothetical protein [Mogibacterium timidum]